MLIAELIWDLQESIADVESAFFHGNLQEEIYMNVPEGLQQDSNSCLLLKKTIYGLVQSARDFNNKLLSTLKSMGFTENKSEPCYNGTNDNLVLIGMYIDDCFVVGKDEEIQQVIQDLKRKGFNLKIESSLKDYLSCCVI
jgi:Reverse transcriptase (RNA-dependent DNA polymerase)